MKGLLSKVLALILGCLTGLLLGVLFKESIDTALLRTSGFGGEILILPLMFLLFYLGYYISKEKHLAQLSNQGEEHI